MSAHPEDSHESSTPEALTRTGRGSLRDELELAPDWDSAETNEQIADLFERESR